jgi:ATP-binding cassette subfamily B protein
MVIARTLRRLVEPFLYLPQTLSLVWAAAKSLTVIWAILMLIQAIVPVIIVCLSRLLVDSLVATIGSGSSWEKAQPLLVLIILTTGVMLLAEVLQHALEWIRTAQSELLQDHIGALIHEKSLAVDLAFYETPEYYDRLHRARHDAGSRSLAVLENGGSLVQNGITLLAMATVLMPYGPWLPLVLLVSTVPAFIVPAFQPALPRMVGTDDCRQALGPIL